MNVTVYSILKEHSTRVLGVRIGPDEPRCHHGDHKNNSFSPRKTIVLIREVNRNYHKVIEFLSNMKLWAGVEFMINRCQR